MKSYAILPKILLIVESPSKCKKIAETFGGASKYNFEIYITKQDKTPSNIIIGNTEEKYAVYDEDEVLLLP